MMEITEEGRFRSVVCNEIQLRGLQIFFSYSKGGVEDMMRRGKFCLCNSGGTSIFKHS